jgi:hypothetical protein
LQNNDAQPGSARLSIIILTIFVSTQFLPEKPENFGVCRASPAHIKIFDFSLGQSLSSYPII